MKLQLFDCENESVPANTPAASRPMERARSFDLSVPYHTPSIQLFDCEMVDLLDGTLAAPRPQGKERSLTVAEPAKHVEQKVVSILLDSRLVPGEKVPSEVDYFREYLSQGWRVKQLNSVSTGGSCGWIIVLLEKELNKLRQPTGLT
jgi:hypothetical protein